MHALRSDDELQAELHLIATELTRRTQQDGKCRKASFPTGYIRRLSVIGERWPYLEKERRRTVACVIQLCDINRWYLNTWDIRLTAGTIWEWHCTLPVIAVMEALLIEYGQQQSWLKAGARFAKAIDEFHTRGVYDSGFQYRLHGWREYRNEIHIYLKGKVEMHDGLPQRYNHAVLTLRELERLLRSHWKAS